MITVNAVQKTIPVAYQYASLSVVWKPSADEKYPTKPPRHSGSTNLNFQKDKRSLIYSKHVNEQTDQFFYLVNVSHIANSSPIASDLRPCTLNITRVMLGFRFFSSKSHSLAYASVFCSLCMPFVTA